ncbi:MAG: hypothetical protein AAF594_02245 [Bacteroidota bacterium]
MASFEITDTEGIVTVTVSGESAPEDGSRILREAAPRLTPGAPLLIDIRPALGPALSFSDFHRYASTLADLSEVYGGRIAVLDDFDERFEMTQFFEASATVRGAAVRAFVSEVAALRWLRDA